VIVRAFGITDAGLVRATNEDAFVVASLDGRRWEGGAPVEIDASASPALLAVSDGMGGAKAGEIASALTVESVLRGMVEASRGKTPDGETLRSVVERASDKVHEAGKRSDRRGMGATLTAALVDGATAFVAQIGDSRAYLLRGGNIGQVTHDQSYVQMLVDAGIMTPEEAERSPRKNIIMQVMGQETVHAALGRIELQSGDRLLLCSDGLTNVLDADAVRRLAESSDVATACRSLIDATKREGAPDNVTVILAEIA
jgi:serine/threonine protein phosphatase PrpC